MDVRINEAFEDYRPPFNATKVVRRLLATVPEEYLRGLDCVVLTNHDALSRKQRVGKIKSRKKRVPAARVRGLYHGKWHGDPAWIEIRVDKTAGTLKRPWVWIPLVQEFYLGDVLYHEVGHHIHSCALPEHREKEDVADDWSRKLKASYFKTKYRWLIWPLRVARKLYDTYRSQRSPSTSASR
jgi:hypothetical protein